MKTANEIVLWWYRTAAVDFISDRERDRLVAVIDEAMADARADERVKATADALAQVSRNFGPRGGTSDEDES